MVVASSSPIRGGPDDSTWMRFYEGKLRNPEVPGHKKYLNDFVETYLTASEGSDWRIFFDQEEQNPNSPWQVVIQKAKRKSNQPIAVLSN